MAVTFVQQDGDPQCGAFGACSGLTVPATTIDRSMAVGATAGSTEVLIDVPAGSNDIRLIFQSAAVGKVTWEGGQWTVTINISTAQNNLVVTGVWICRVAESPDCSSIAEVAADTAVSRDISTAGAHSFTLTGAETSDATHASAADTDTVYVLLRIQNTHSMTSRSVGVTPNQTVESPIAEPEIVTAETHPATDVTDESATLNGDVTELSGVASCDAWFEWRAVGASTWTETAPQTLTEAGTFSDAIAGLSADTDYEFRAQAETANESSTGATVGFTTEPPPPAFFDVQIDATNSPVGEGSTMTVDYTVTNTGGVQGTKDVALNILSGRPLGEPASWWPFDEASGTALNDDIGTLHGSIFGAQWQTDAGFGDAYLAFDGTDDHVDLGTITIPNTNGAFSFVSWIYPNDPQGSSQTLFGNSNEFYFHKSGSENLIYFTLDANAERVNVVPAADLTQRWIMIAVTRDESGNLNAYHDDAVLTDTGAHLHTPAAATLSFAANGSASAFFNGRMDYTVMYDYALTAQDVSDIHAATSGNYA